MSAEATLYRIHCILQARAAPCCVQPSRTKTTRDDADDDPSDRAKKRQATPQDLQEELAMLRQERDQLSQDKIELEQRNASLEATVNAIENELQNSECSVCQNTLHDPMTLPCGHNYCGACVQTWSEKSQQKDKKYGFMVAACPDCRQEFQPSAIQHNLLFGRIANRFVEAADGQEHTEHANDGVYTGQMFRGRREGRGVLMGKNGSRYEGEFKNGKEHGQGQMTYANGDKYVGSWKKGKKEGMGIYTFINNDTYDGEWKNGVMHGQGTMTYASGNKYVGQWVREKKEGRGFFTWTDGATYDGEWKNGHKNGQGTMTSINGKYVGQWKWDKPDGRGFSTWPDGTTYDGEWKNNQKHGYGIYKLENGEIYDGQWKDNASHGHGVYTWPNGCAYDGEFQKNFAHGYGTMRYFNGDKYVGLWTDDVRQGQGVYTWSNDSSFTGLWDEHDPDIPASGVFSRGPSGPRVTVTRGADQRFRDRDGVLVSGVLSVPEFQPSEPADIPATSPRPSPASRAVSPAPPRPAPGAAGGNHAAGPRLSPIVEADRRWTASPSPGGARFAVGDRVKVNNYIDWSGMPYIDVDAPDPLRGTVLEVEEVEDDIYYFLIKFDDSDRPLRVSEENVLRAAADDPGPPEPGPRDLQENERVIVVGTGAESVDGTTGYVQDFDDEHGIWYIRSDTDPGVDLEKYHVDRLRRTGPAPRALR